MKGDSYPWCSAETYRRALDFSFCDECGQPMIKYCERCYEAALAALRQDIEAW